MDGKRLVLSLSLVAALAAAAPVGGGQSSLLTLPLEPTTTETQALPLTSVLSNIGSRVRGGSVLFAVQVLLHHGKEPVVTLPVRPSTSLGSAIREVMRQLPSYEMRVASAHLIEIFPQGAENDPNNILNIRVAKFDVTDKSAGSILSSPQRYIPELAAQLARTRPGTARGPTPDGGIFSVDWPVTLHLRDVTIRELLNRVSEATEQPNSDEAPLGWVCKVSPDASAGIAESTFQALPSGRRGH